MPLNGRILGILGALDDLSPLRFRDVKSVQLCPFDLAANLIRPLRE